VRKIACFTIIGALFLAACSGPIQRSDAYPRPLPKKSAIVLVREASKHIGEPYHYGGMSTKGWDCSGFVWTMFQKSLNIRLARTSDDMLQSSIAMPSSNARPGDLVFFNFGRKKVSHVGIYIGNDRFIHVSKSDGVVVSSLNDPYYRRYFLGLRRLTSDLIASTR
jgi:cell wall-associated NlpC family hydrolase